MDDEKRAKLEAAGWTVSDNPEDFLDETEKEEEVQASPLDEDAEREEPGS